jgi:hypothetical protein
MTAVTIPRESVERLVVDIVTDADPTALPVEFAVTPCGAQPATWLAGAWVGAPVQRGQRFETTARTPLIGAPPLDLTPGRWVVWLRYATGAETFIVRAGEVGIT